MASARSLVSASVVASLVLMSGVGTVFSGTQKGSKAVTQAAASRFLEGHGYRVHCERKSPTGTISKGSDQAGISFGEGSESNGHRWTSVSLSAAFLLPHPIDQKAVSVWFRSQKAGDCRLVARVDDVVTLEDWSIEFDGKSDPLGEMDRFWQIRRDLKKTFRAEQKSSAWQIGRCPENTLSLTALSFDELVTMGSAWKWKVEGGVSDLGMVFGTVTINQVELSISTGFYPIERFTVSADVPVARGVDAVSLAKRLQGQGPVVWSKEATALVDSGKQVESFGAGRKPKSYSWVLMFKFNGMTVGDFRKTIEDFARRAKALPHK
ncbi:MAG: hypothetical protein ACHQ50_10830 [Fimbriimonadales bacterium]